MSIKSAKKRVYILIATICVGLGFAGTVLPIMPTTPFLLLAIFFYMRSSKQGIKRILNNKVLAPYVKSYFSKKGIPLPILIRTLILLWLTIGSCIIWATDNIYVSLSLGIIAICVSVHLYLKRSKMRNNLQNNN